MREVPSIPAGLEPKLRNVLSSVRESLNSAITNINANADNLNGLRQWVMPALEANNDLVIFNQGQINAALESATGADGAAGIAARAVSLTTPKQSFTYDTNGANPSPSTSVITATIFNTVGVVYYEFFLNDVSTGTATTSNTYTYTPKSTFTGMPDKLEVQIREDGLDGAIEARDQMTMIGLKAGSHGITVMLSNEAHTLPRTVAGVVTYTGSGTKINVWEGTTALTEDSSSPYANSTFRVTTAATGITPGSITGTGTTTLTYGDANSMTISPAKIDFTIIAKRQDGTEITISKQQSLSYSQAGATGAGGDSVDIVFVRSATQPATPTASPGTPTAPITWYTDVASVPASANPLWSSAGFKASASANYTWDKPVRVEGASVAEVTVFTRGVPTSTPTGGTYTFSNPPVLAVPTSTGATWYTSIPSGTTAVYTSRAVVSTAAGNTSAVAITGWTTPVISFQNGIDGSPGSNGSNGSRGPFTTYAAIGYPGWDSATAYAAIMAMPNNQSTLVVGDEVTLCYPNTTTPTWVLTQYVATIGNPGTWSVRGQVIDGNLMVTGTLSAASLKTSNLTAANAISVVNASNALRVKMGNLGATYGIQGWNSANASVFKLDENGLDSKITQNALNLFGCSYHNRIIFEGNYTFTIFGTAVQTVILPISIFTLGMFRLKAQVTGYWENDNVNVSHALWREMSMGVYFRNSTQTSLNKPISMDVVGESADTTNPDFPASKVTLQVNATTEQPELKLVSRAGTAGINNTTTYSYIVWAIDNIAYPYQAY
jgi:hypothetical protein